MRTEADWCRLVGIDDGTSMTMVTPIIEEPMTLGWCKTATTLPLSRGLSVSVAPMQVASLSFSLRQVVATWL